MRFFVDIRAAFDSVDRGILLRMLRKRGIREDIVTKCEDVLKETRSVDKVGEESGREFWDRKSD